MGLVEDVPDQACRFLPDTDDDGALRLHGLGRGGDDLFDLDLSFHNLRGPLDDHGFLDGLLHDLRHDLFDFDHLRFGGGAAGRKQQGKDHHQDQGCT